MHDDSFKAPSTIPQDLLLIQELVDVVVPSNTESSIRKTIEDSDISSSGSSDSDSTDSEEDAVNLTKSPSDEDTKIEKDVLVPPHLSSSDSDSDSDSDSESSESNKKTGEESNEIISRDFEEDEDPLPSMSTGNHFATRNEITNVPVVIPELDEVHAYEKLEKVGEIMNIVGRVVIVRGLPSLYLNHASERALDSDTLLVFDDRKVLGYIYETFGPTMQPLYQVKFPENADMDPERVKNGREVFHVPSRSNFVFVSQIKGLRGSDASNVNDEEPVGDENEFFSDDEAESAHRNRLKRRNRDSRRGSVASSRSMTPNPTFMRDQELEAAEQFFMSGDAYDEHGPYDIDYTSLTAPPASCRPPPTAYDDPYTDSSYIAPDVAELSDSGRQHDSSSFNQDRPSRGRKRGRGFGERGHRGRGRNFRQHQQMSPPSMPFDPSWTSYYPTSQPHEEYSPLYPQQGSMPMQYPCPPLYAPQPTGFEVQPHINPRFASAFGFSMYPPSAGTTPDYYYGDPHAYESSSQGEISADDRSVPMQDFNPQPSQ